MDSQVKNLMDRFVQLELTHKMVFLWNLNEEEADKFFCLLKNTSEDFCKSLFGEFPTIWQNWLNPTSVSKSGDWDINECLTVIEKKLNELPDTLKTNEQMRAFGNEKIQRNRDTMKHTYGEDSNGNYFISDQSLGLAKPDPEVFYEQADLIDLPKPKDDILVKKNIFECIADRKSLRSYADKPITLDELSFLTWATQGVRKIGNDGNLNFRTAPSGGARQPYETYLAIQNVQGLKPGLYRYIAFKHKLLLIREDNELSEKLNKAAMQQSFAGRSAVMFFWAVVPYRTEWRYGPESIKTILQESGHICQNLYLACEAIECGTCGIDSYNQVFSDQLFGLDGKDQFIVYCAPVGKK